MSLQPLRIKELTIDSTGIKDLSLQGRGARNADYRQVATKSFKRSRGQKMTISLEEAGPIEVMPPNNVLSFVH